MKIKRNLSVGKYLVLSCLLLSVLTSGIAKAAPDGYVIIKDISIPKGYLVQFRVTMEQGKSEHKISHTLPKDGELNIGYPLEPFNFQEEVKITLKVLTSTCEDFTVGTVFEYKGKLTEDGGDFSVSFNEFAGRDPPIYKKIMVFPTSERFLGSDLNSDGDTDDTILCYQNLKTGEVVNTGLIASGAYHSMDIYENIIAFVGKDSHVYYYDINTGAMSDIGITGSYPSIYDNVIAFVSQGTIHYFSLTTQTLTNTEIQGDNPAIYQNLIVFHTSPEFMIWVYDLRTGAAVNTGIIGKNTTLYETVVAFVTPEFKVAEDLNGDGDTNDLVIQYYNSDTQAITNIGAVGKYPSIYGNRIVFTTDEQDVNQDLNGDGTILGNVIRYYDLETGNVVNTRQFGTEPDIYEDTITFYLWERWTGQDLNGDGDSSDPIVDTYQITVTEMSVTGPEVWFFLALLVIGGITACLERK